MLILLVWPLHVTESVSVLACVLCIWLLLCYLCFEPDLLTKKCSYFDIKHQRQFARVKQLSWNVPLQCLVGSAVKTIAKYANFDISHSKWKYMTDRMFAQSTVISSLDQQDRVRGPPPLARAGPKIACGLESRLRNYMDSESNPACSVD